MSLDVYLMSESSTEDCCCPTCDHAHKRMVTEDLYNANITHNLCRMASEAGIYEALWRPDEIGIETAEQLISPLEKGLSLMRADRQRFEAFNASNGWGLYENFVPWVERYLEACREHPHAKVSASR